MKPSLCTSQVMATYAEEKDFNVWLHYSALCCNAIDPLLAVSTKRYI